MINENSLKLVSKIFIFITIFLVVDILFEHFSGKDFFGNNDGAKYNRLSGPFGDEWIVGFFLLYFGFLSFGLFIKHHKVNKLFYFIFIITICYTIYLTGERNAFFCSLIFIFLMIILDKESRKIFSLSFLVIVILFTISNKYNIVGNKYSLAAINLINTAFLIKKIIPIFIRKKSSIINISGGGSSKYREYLDRKSTRLNSSHRSISRMPSSA
jgi:hypothetical protein